jgi:hypothetical protein
MASAVTATGVVSDTAASPASTVPPLARDSTPLPLPLTAIQAVNTRFFSAKRNRRLAASRSRVSRAQPRITLRPSCARRNTTALVRLVHACTYTASCSTRLCDDTMRPTAWALEVRADIRSSSCRTVPSTSRARVWSRHP